MLRTKNAIFALIFIVALPVVGSANFSKECINKVRNIAIVDGYSSGKLLPAEIRKQAREHGEQAKIFHIHSEGKPISFLASTFIRENFDEDYAYDGKFKKLTQYLVDNKIEVIMVGAESGVLLADKLSTKLNSTLGTPTNGILKARRDKYQMGELLRSKGIDAVRQLKSSSFDEILKWAKENNFWPVVTKPILSAGTDGVSVSKNETELRIGFNRIMNNKDEFGKQNKFVLAQEFLDGIEYTVNVVVSNGQIVFTDIWQYYKKLVSGAGYVYEHDRLLPYDGDVQAKLIEYSKKVIHAFEIKTGWGHLEIKMTSRGPVLVEIGSRMMGSSQPRLVSEAAEEGQVQLGVEAYLYPDLFAKRKEPYQMKLHAANVSINSLNDEQILSYQIVPELIQLRSYKRHSFTFEAGSVVNKTVDMNTIILQVELLHEDPKVLEQDIKTLKIWEEQGAFTKSKK